MPVLSNDQWNQLNSAKGLNTNLTLEEINAALPQIIDLERHQQSYADAYYGLMNTALNASSCTLVQEDEIVAIKGLVYQLYDLHPELSIPPFERPEA
jgi:hypothetical protein